jgi:glycerophosphoryl diester phosphodiesterase
MKMIETAAGRSDTGLLAIAHRGAWAADVPENSLAAFERAIALGADMIEFDIRRSRDDELIIFHDEDHIGTPVADLSRAELAQRTGELPALLQEVLALAAGRIAVDAELKEDGYVDRVARLLATFASEGGELIATSFVDSVIGQLTELTPQLRRGLLLEHSAQDAAQRAAACGATSVLPEMKLVDEALVCEISDGGFELIVWDFMAAEHEHLVADARVSGVITDDVPGALVAREAHGRGR